MGDMTPLPAVYEAVVLWKMLLLFVVVLIMFVFFVCYGYLRCSLLSINDDFR